jgi:hypothetical protein
MAVERSLVCPGGVVLSSDEALRMAQLMRARGEEIARLVKVVEVAHHGVVVLRFSDGCRELAVELADEPFTGEVRVYSE